MRYLARFSLCRSDGRVVKALDSKSNGVSPRRFESCLLRFFFSFFVQISADVAPSRPVVRLLLPPADTARPPCSVEGLSHTGAAEVTRWDFTLSITLNVGVGNVLHCTSLKYWQGLHTLDPICPGQGRHACQLPFAGAVDEVGGSDTSLCGQ